MGARLEALRALQNVELQIVDIRRQLQAKERLIAAQGGKLQGGEGALGAEREQLNRAQREFDALDVEIKARSGHIVKLREHLNSVKTNKEYATVLQQLNNEKADLSKLESRALELMTRVEEARASLGAHETALGGERRRLEELRGQLEAARNAYSKRLAELTAERERAAAGLDPATLVHFQRLSDRYDGEALAEVSRPSPRRDEYICNGCHMSLTAEIANALAVRDDVISCRSCGRILYLGKK